MPNKKLSSIFLMFSWIFLWLAKKRLDKNKKYVYNMGMMRTEIKNKKFKRAGVPAVLISPSSNKKEVKYES